MSRYRHNCTRSVTDEHIIGDPNRHALTVHRIDGVGSGEHAGFLFRQLSSFEIAFPGSFLAIGRDGVGMLRSGKLFHKGMFGGNHHVGCSEQRIGARGIDPQNIFIGIARPTIGGTLFAPLAKACFITNEEIDLGTRATANPISLQGLNAFRPIKVVEPCFKSIGIGSNSQHPLP